MTETSPFPPKLTADDRAFIAVAQLGNILRELERLAESDPQVLMSFQIELDDADTRLSLLRPRLRMKRSLVHLTSSMGRAP
jgi:hypothetical protein